MVFGGFSFNAVEGYDEEEGEEEEEEEKEDATMELVEDDGKENVSKILGDETRITRTRNEPRTAR